MDYTLLVKENEKLKQQNKLLRTKCKELGTKYSDALHKRPEYGYKKAKMYGVIDCEVNDGFP